MKHSFLAVFVGFSVILTPVAALAAPSVPAPTERYLVQTSKSLWRSAFRARNIVDGGFTADLTTRQVQLARFAGLKLSAVKHFNILAQATPSASASPVPTPTRSTPWGVQSMLNGSPSGDGGAEVHVAILDTGIDREHPDVRARVSGCFNTADLSKNFIDDSCADGNGHGTHVAGIIAADGGADGHGIFGLAPESSLLIYRVCDDTGSCLSDDISVAIRSAVDKGANIIVLGLGGEETSSLISDALAYAAEHDVLIVAAAGNGGPDNAHVDWPARNPLVVAVGAVDQDGDVADFSSRGEVEFIAPGVDVESTFNEEGYATLSGTSMAAPHIAGLAAYLWQKDAEHPAAATRAMLHQLVGTDAKEPGMPRLSK